MTPGQLWTAFHRPSVVIVGVVLLLMVTRVAMTVRVSTVDYPIDRVHHTSDFESLNSAIISTPEFRERNRSDRRYGRFVQWRRSSLLYSEMGRTGDGRRNWSSLSPFRRRTNVAKDWIHERERKSLNLRTVSHRNAKEEEPGNDSLRTSSSQESIRPQNSCRTFSKASRGFRAPGFEQDENDCGYLFAEPIYDHNGPLKVLHIQGLFELTDPSRPWQGCSELAAACLAIHHINQRRVIPGHRLVMYVNDTEVIDPFMNYFIFLMI